MFPDVPPKNPEPARSAIVFMAGPAPQAPVAPVAPIVLPARLPAQCFLAAARDYVVPPMVLVAIVKHESRGHSVSHLNSNGTVDFGVAQINDASWGRYMRERFNISTEKLLSSPCQSIRVMAYALRWEMNNAECRGVDVWCGVDRYHSPNSMANRAAYVPKVQAEMIRIESTRRFE